MCSSDLILIAGGGAVPAGAKKPEPGAVPAAPATPAAPAAPVQMAGAGSTITSTAGDSFAGSAMPQTAQTPAPTAGAVPVGGTTTAVPAGPVAAAPQGTGTGVALTPTDPNNPLTTQTIAPDNAVDRFKLAEERFNTFTKSTDPAYQAALRDAKRTGAAVGGLGSGQLRTRVGDLANQRGLALDTSRDTLMQEALGGSIEDMYRNVGIAQQQQGFQQGQQQQGFENELRRLGFSEEMLNSAFGRSLQQWMAGQTGGTGSSTALLGAKEAGNAGSDALAALEAFARQRAASGVGGSGGPAVSTLPTTSQPDDALSKLFQYGGRA